MPRAAIIFALALLAACATTGVDKRAEPAAAAVAESTDARRAEEPGVDLDALAAREFGELPKRSIAFPDGAFQAEVEAAGEPSVSVQDKLLVLEVPVGTETPVVCYLYPEGIDTGATLMNVAALVGKTGKVHDVRPIDVVALDENPAMFVEIDYLFDAEQGALAGRLKSMVHAHPTHPLLCMHDEFGYSAAFQRVALGLARSLTAKTDFVTSRYSELQILKVNGQPFGFTRMQIRDGAEGASIFEWVGTRLVPTEEGMDAEDEAKTAISDAQGRIVTVGYAASTNGVLGLQAEARRKAANEYVFQGTKDGQPFSGSFKTRDPAGLPSDLSVAAAIRDELLSGKQSQLAVEEYLPSSNPSAPTGSVVRKSDEGPKAVSVEIGGSTLFGRVDGHGLLELAEMRTPALTVTYERAFVRGQP